MTPDPVSSAAAALTVLIGQRLGPSGWIEITQARINRFTEATDDPQWIHIDEEAAAQGPFGATIAQGYLTMSLIVTLTSEIDLPLQHPPTMTINYGLNRLRFPSPVPVGSQLRAWVEISDVERIGDWVQLTRLVTIEREKSAKPAAVAETVSRLRWGTS